MSPKKRARQLSERQLSQNWPAPLSRNAEGARFDEPRALFSGQGRVPPAGPVPDLKRGRAVHRIVRPLHCGRAGQASFAKAVFRSVGGHVFLGTKRLGILVATLRKTAVAVLFRRKRCQQTLACVMSRAGRAVRWSAFGNRMKASAERRRVKSCQFVRLRIRA